MTFAPWSEGHAAWSDDRKVVTATIAVTADLGLTIQSVEVVEGVFLVATFAVAEDSPLHER